MHFAAAFGAFERNFIDIRLVQLDIALYAAQFFEFGFGSHNVNFAAIGANPYGKRSSPIAFSRQSPVDDVFEEVAHSARSYAGRNPVDRRVVAQKVVLYRSHFYKPGGTRVVQKRSIASPAERITVREHHGFEQQSAFFEIF